MMENILEEMMKSLRVFLGYNETYAEVFIEDGEVLIHMDLPSEENYNYAIELVELFFEEEEYDIEEYYIDGDYEGIISISQE